MAPLDPPTLGFAAGIVAAVPAVAGAHAGGAAFIQLLPTHLYLAGAAVAVAASFVLVALIPSQVFARMDSLHARLAVVRVQGGGHVSTVASLVSLVGVVGLVVAGVVGSRDPLSNPLPLFVWAVWWIGFTYLHAALGDLWSHVNPWIGIHRLLTAAGPLSSWRSTPPIRYPARAASWPAVAGLGLFAWFELIHPAPMDPSILADAVAGYVLAHLLAVLLFGPEWLARAETFSVFFRMISLVAPFALRRSGEGRAGEEAPRQLEITAPSLGLLRTDARDAGVFVLAMVPIVCGYHFAHYLPVFLVDVQWALRAASDPFARGSDLLGTRGFHVVTSFLSDSSRVYAIWHAQVGLIVGAHVAGVVVAHALAVRLAGGRAVVAGQLPLLVLMIGYTVLGLWLLSTPSVG